MKVTVSPQGEVSFDTDDVGQALSMIKALRNGAKPVGKPRGPYKKKPPVEEIVEEVPLSPAMAETWQWLVDNDSSAGSSIDDIARGLGVTHSTATWRLNQLIANGVAYRSRRGHYRPGESA